MRANSFIIFNFGWQCWLITRSFSFHSNFNTVCHVYCTINCSKSTFAKYIVSAVCHNKSILVTECQTFTLCGKETNTKHYDIINSLCWCDVIPNDSHLFQDFLGDLLRTENLQMAFFYHAIYFSNIFELHKKIHKICRSIEFLVLYSMYHGRITYKSVNGKINIYCDRLNWIDRYEIIGEISPITTCGLLSINELFIAEYISRNFTHVNENIRSNGQTQRNN